MKITFNLKAIKTDKSREIVSRVISGGILSPSDREYLVSEKVICNKPKTPKPYKSIPKIKKP